MKRLWRWLFGPPRRLFDVPPLVLEFEADDWCCICLRDLAADEVYEVREHGGIDDHEGGGSWVVRTYCPEHAPPDALAPVPSAR